MNSQPKSYEIDLPEGIGKPALRALEAAGLFHLTDFSQLSEEQLQKLHGLGPKALRIIAAVMEVHGLQFAPKENSEKISEKANQKIVRRG